MRHFRPLHPEVQFQHDLDYYKSEVLAKSIIYEEELVVKDNENRRTREYTLGPSTATRERKPGNSNAVEVDNYMDDDEDLIKKEPNATSGAFHSGDDDLYNASDPEDRTNRPKAIFI